LTTTENTAPTDVVYSDGNGGAVRIQQAFKKKIVQWKLQYVE
jgi:hypothetical protein